MTELEDHAGAMRVAALCLCVAIALLAGGCGRDDAQTTTPGNPSPLASAAATATAIAPTAPSVGATTPDEAALGLYRSWLDDDASTASQFATPQAVNELFAHPSSRIQFNSCSPSGAKYRCFFYYEGGGLNMNVEGSATSGYQVTKAFFIAD